MEWFKWIRYGAYSCPRKALTTEMARAVSDDNGPVATYDLKLVWSFMKNGFVSSRLKMHFPDDPSAKDDVLSADAFKEPIPQARDLKTVMATTLGKLLAQPGAPEPIASPPQQLDYSFSPSRVSPVRVKSPQVASSPDTVGDASMAREEPSADRHPELEPWAWANTLVAGCNDVARSARPRQVAPRKEHKLHLVGTSTVLSKRTIESAEWTIVEEPSGKRKWSVVGVAHTSVRVLVHSSEGDDARQAVFEVPDGEILQASFFDDDEVMVLFQHGGQRYLSAAHVSALEDGLQSVVSAIISQSTDSSLITHSHTPSQSHEHGQWARRGPILQLRGSWRSMETRAAGQDGYSPTGGRSSRCSTWRVTRMTRRKKRRRRRWTRSSIHTMHMARIASV